jgi:predicted dehydrogenase
LNGALEHDVRKSGGRRLINLAVVGLGKFGRRHVDTAIASGRFRVVRAVVRNPGPAQEYASARDIQLSTDLAEALEDPLVDAVSLVTPHRLHVPQIIQAAAAGKHVLAEKPFALTAADAEKAVSACARAGVVVAVGHDNRFYPAIREVKRLVDGGTLGTIIHAEAHLSHDLMRKASVAARAVLPGAERTNARPSTGAWRLDCSEAPVGSMAHLGVHRIDTFVQLFGRVTQVFALPGPKILNVGWDDTLSVLLKFAAGLSAYVSSSLATPLSSRMQIFGSGGGVEVTGPRDFKEYLRASLRTVSVQGADGSFQTREFEAGDSVMSNFRAFADAIEEKAPYPVPPEEIIHVPAVLEAITRSLASGCAVSIA